MTDHSDPHFIEGACICLCPACSGVTGCTCPDCAHHENPYSAVHGDPALMIPVSSITYARPPGNVFQLDDGDTGEAMLPVPLPVTPGSISVQWVYNDPKGTKIAELETEIVELKDELALLKREYRVEAIHSDPEAPCDVCDHLMLEDQIERAEIAERGMEVARQFMAEIRALTKCAAAFCHCGGDRVSVPTSEINAAFERDYRCRADTDGDCSWQGCPQLRDGEPKTTGRHCPLDLRDEDR